ncbi:MAG: hypothetical protein J5998_07700 [Clostridia bacterium]|nr:hypothetical protein [Clostridia bacterium]
MLGIIYLALYEASGCLIANRLFARRGLQTRLWLGLTLGCGMLMWFPSLFAFALRFTMAAQWLGAGLSLILAGLSLLLPRRARRSPAEDGGDGEPPLRLTLGAVIPLAVVMAFMQYTHTLRPEGGALWTGQSTYGDMNLHLGIATGLVNQPFPPDYTILPGTLLGYPFLVDAASASLYMTGMGLRWAFIVPGVLMCALVFWGFLMLAWEMTKSWRAALLSFALMFLNGGLGFAYLFDLVGKDPSRLFEAFEGFYKAPANLVDVNIRWVNVLVDMLLPQRTLMAGWLAVIPALWLLMRCVKERRTGLFIALGVWAGAMPMIHTHSFLALGLISAGVMVMSLSWAKPGQRGVLLRGFLCYGFIAVALAAPQLFTWTFPQTLEGVEGGSFRLRFNWVNWQDGGLLDEYFWFWIKNVGLVYIVMIPAAMAGTKRQKMLAVGALLVYVAAELFQFQQNEYDNNKLFYVAFIAMLPIAAQYLVALYDRLAGLPGRALIAALFIAASTCSGAISVARECVSNYQLYGPGETAAAAWIRENAPEHAVFLTGTQHNNAVSSLAGGRLVCGTPSFLYYHGVDYARQMNDARAMFEAPGQNLALFERYGIDYVFVSGSERYNYALDEETIAALWALVWEENGVRLYAVSERALAAAGAAPG